jgi:hypothetical protein
MVRWINAHPQFGIEMLRNDVSLAAARPFVCIAMLRPARERITNASGANMAPRHGTDGSMNERHGKLSPWDARFLSRQRSELGRPYVDRICIGASTFGRRRKIEEVLPTDKFGCVVA